MSTIEVLLLRKVNVGVMAVPASFCAVAARRTVAPTCNEKLVPVFSVIFAGKGELAAVFLPPQAGNNNNKDKEMLATTPTRAPQRKLMHPLVALKVKTRGRATQ